MTKYSRFVPKSQAIALGYDEESQEAPRVIASGNDLIAEQIIAIAKENNIPIHHDADLARILSLLEINSYIPVEVYGVVAKIISYIIAQKKEKSKKIIK